MYISEPCKGNQATIRLLTPWQPSPGGVMALSKYPVNDHWMVTWLLHSGYSGERSISHNCKIEWRSQFKPKYIAHKLPSTIPAEHFENTDSPRHGTPLYLSSLFFHCPYTFFHCINSIDICPKLAHIPSASHDCPHQICHTLHYSYPPLPNFPRASDHYVIRRLTAKSRDHSKPIYWVI